MEKLTVIHWIAIICGLLLSVSEALPFTNVVRSNGILQAFLTLLGFGKNLKD